MSPAFSVEERGSAGYCPENGTFKPLTLWTWLETPLLHLKSTGAWVWLAGLHFLCLCAVDVQPLRSYPCCPKALWHWDTQQSMSMPIVAVHFVEHLETFKQLPPPFCPQPATSHRHQVKGAAHECTEGCRAPVPSGSGEPMGIHSRMEDRGKALCQPVSLQNCPVHASQGCPTPASVSARAVAEEGQEGVLKGVELVGQRNE